MSSTLEDAIVLALALRYSPELAPNPAYRGYRRTPEIEPDIERTLDQRMRDTCMTVFTDVDGHRSLRALTYREVAEVAVAALESAGVVPPAGSLPASAPRPVDPGSRSDYTSRQVAPEGEGMGSKGTSVDVQATFTVSDLRDATAVLRHDLAAGYFDEVAGFEQTANRVLAAWQAALAAANASTVSAALPREDWLAAYDVLAADPDRLGGFLTAVAAALHAD